MIVLRQLWNADDCGLVIVVMDRGSNSCGPVVAMEVRRRMSSCALEEDDDGEGSGVRVLWVLIRRDGSASGFVGGGDGGVFFSFFLFFCYGWWW